ncbi:MAG: copper chaperone PCu(A)C [Candidatus Dadabacteria bacterium]|nr:copper chaperone PCu(A)C [Candidatus Dadabacteria bacterium]
MKKILWEALFIILIPVYSFGSPKIEIKEPWVREVPPVSPVTAVYMVIENEGNEDDRLIDVSTEAASQAEIHDTLIDEKGIAKMQRFESMDIPSGKGVELKPGGSHVMLIGLKKALKAGDKIELNLKFEKSGIIKIQAQVK